MELRRIRLMFINNIIKKAKKKLTLNFFISAFAFLIITKKFVY